MKGTLDLDESMYGEWGFELKIFRFKAFGGVIMVMEERKREREREMGHFGISGYHLGGGL